MKETNQVFIRGLNIILFSVFIISCASISELKALYQLPPKSEKLKGKKAALRIVDARSETGLLMKGAQKEYKYFPGNISLSIGHFKEPGFKIGVFQVPDMMKEAFKRSLENAGFELLIEQFPEEPQLMIVLNELFLDLVNQKWVAKINYEAMLVKNEKVLATQTISGQAERYKLVGRGQADVVMGEILTDTVNSLDVAKLFQQGKVSVP